ncbi:Na,H/K antiporter P-type ATPase [Truncatella angustata]|uniref:Na,H/K antiporter P-type ATPase n=1 Tax=Truncatella angustata TaxID=152316 RepID=A0A9P8RN04_9PEZI|nr:Na,H/K antiporter P-type ATPase [Truncatella angustata]KAH6646966.1 Na,H/K antiporter P-type ATPase [Truncatella angustata]
MSMSIDEPDLKHSVAERIRWEDEEAARPRGLRRTHSRGSMSIHSVRSRREVDPSIALPIQYRTVSFGIEESKAKDAVELEKAKDVATKELSSLEWHTITTDEAIRRLGSSVAEGLSPDQVERKFKEFGRNAPTPPKSNALATYLGYMFKGFGPVLLVGAILVFVSWKPLGEPNPAIANLALAIVLLAVFFIQAGFNMWQDFSSSRVMKSIKNMLPEDCLVIRDGKQQLLSAVDLVPGDVTILKAGNKLPADVRFLQVSGDARFDRSILTGESVPLAATVDSTDDNYLETKNIGLQGTHCTSGSCTGIVVGTGDRTVFGRIANLTNEPKTKMTTLEREVLYFVVIICSIMFTMIAIVLIVWGSWLRAEHPGWISVPALIVSCVSVAIAFIPEGLPIAVTAGLTITANIMQKNKVLCKSLKTVETLGSVSVICSDKTGTLTQNLMTVTECTIGTHTITAEDAELELGPKAAKTGTDPAPTGISQIRALSALCNAAEFDAATNNLPVEQRRIYGDATDQAILRFSEKLGSVSHMRQSWQKTYELAFNSKNKFMIRTFFLFKDDCLAETLPQAEASAFKQGDTLLTIKGAPDVIIGRCSSYINSAGDVCPFDADMRATIEGVKNMYSAQGKRCILLARKTIRREDVRNQTGSTQFEDEMVEQAKTGLTLVGLVAIVDPLRPEIKSVVSTLRGAGIRFFMVTGDFALTALAIAQEAGIVTLPTPAVHGLDALPREESTDSDSEKVMLPRQSIVLSGPDLMGMSAHQWKVLTQYEEVVFARTTPEQKLRIVKEFQASGVVAMTGDGVNDAPSLKAADIGIAMGSGSDIAIEAADMVLLDSFASIVEAVQYGRVVFDNLKKVICYLLPAGSFAEFWPVMTNVLFGLPQILSSFLMIIICCFTDCAAATALSYEKPEADVLLRKPRDVKKDRLVNWQLIVYAYGVLGMLETLSSFAVSYWYLARNNIPFGTLWFGFGTIPDGVTSDEYAQRLNEASSIYFINLVVMQWFNLMAVRTRRWSIFQQPPAFNKLTQNLWLFPAIVFALLMAIFWLYVPVFQAVLGTTEVPVEHYFLPFAFGTFILLVDEGRKFLVRKYPHGAVAKFAW